jgi:hypothetical protein
MADISDSTRMNINLQGLSDKLEELVLHISVMSEKDGRFGSTKLNKLIWTADFKAFCQTGRTITGATYQKEKYGPVPKAMPIVLERLKTEGRLSLKPTRFGFWTGARPVAEAGARPDLTAFSQQELATVDKVIAESFGKTGTDMSTESHKLLAYKVAKIGETIPFPAWLISARKPTENQKRHGHALAFAHARQS